MSKFFNYISWLEASREYCKNSKFYTSGYEASINTFFFLINFIRVLLLGFLIGGLMTLFKVEIITPTAINGFSMFFTNSIMSFIGLFILTNGIALIGWVENSIKQKLIIH